jgi:hypothetical protein
MHVLHACYMHVYMHVKTCMSDFMHDKHACPIFGGLDLYRLAPKVIFLRKSQVKSPKSQVMTLTFLKDVLKSRLDAFSKLQSAI